jgi:membrane glycosyltransferase
VLDPFYNAVHISLQHERKTISSEEEDYGARLAVRLFEGGPGVLSAQEKRALLSDGPAMALLHTLIWKTPAANMNPQWAKALLEYRTLVHAV